MELQALGALWQILVLLPSLDKSRRWNCRQRRDRKHGFVTRFVAFIKNRRPRRRCSHGVLAASVAIGSITGDGKHSATALTGESDKARGGNELQNCPFESRFSTRSSTVHRLKSVSQPGWRCWRLLPNPKRQRGIYSSTSLTHRVESRPYICYRVAVRPNFGKL